MGLLCVVARAWPGKPGGYWDLVVVVRSSGASGYFSWVARLMGCYVCWTGRDQRHEEPWNQPSGGPRRVPDSGAQPRCVMGRRG